MQLLKVITARSIWLLPIADMNPRGKAIDTALIEWLKRTYHFQKYPSSAFDLDSETKTLVFLGGKFKSGHEEDGKERYIIVGLTVYNDGLVANTESSTNDSDKFLDEALHSAAKEFGLVHPVTRKKLYFSEMDVQLDRPISLVNPKLEQLASRISELRKELPVTFEFSGVTFLPEPSAQATTSGFSIERKVNTEWSENRYYTRAPLQTDAHLQILEEFETLLAQQ
jgi:hypothetical protein